MKSIRKLFMVVFVTVAMLAAGTLPAIAASPGDSVVLFPEGNGVTYSCTGGPPFVHDTASSGNCAFEQVGAPAGLVCDIPTTITIVHDGHPYVANAELCEGASGSTGA